MGSFLAGLLHPITAFEHALAFVALGMLLGQRPKGDFGLAAFWIALTVGAAASLWLPHVPAIDLANIGSALVLGGLVAAAAPLPIAASMALAALFGLSHGYANGLAMTYSTKALAYIVGVGLAGLFVAGYAFAATDYLLKRRIGWITIAVRVAGSWIAAIAILVLATSWKRLTG